MFNSCPFLAVSPDPALNWSETIKNINILISKLPRKSTERVRSSQWVIKLKQSDSQSDIRDQYLHLLFSQLSNNRLSNPFLHLPPNKPLAPLGLGPNIPLYQKHSITPPALSGTHGEELVHRRSNSIEMSLPFQNGNSLLTPPSRHRHSQNMVCSYF